MIQIIKSNSLRKKLNVMKREISTNILPDMAFIEKVDCGWEVIIGFWDGKEGSGNKMPDSLKKQFDTFQKADQFLTSYLKLNKHRKPFVVFYGEEDLED